MTEWIAGNTTLIGWMALLSGIAFVATLVLVPLLVVRIPRFYFASGRRHQSRRGCQNSVLRWLLIVAKNLLGIVLVAAGFVMFFLPGQGLLTLLLGLMMMSFPGKSSFERWLVTRPPIFAVVTGLRKRAGREPLVFECEDE